MMRETIKEIPKETAKRTKRMTKKRIGLAFFGVLVLAIGGFVGLRANTAKPEKAGRNSKDQITLVTVVKVTQKTVPVQIKAIGTVQAGETVAVTPQAGGRITEVLFKKGDDVRKGQLLFTLDDRSQTAVIQQAQGTVAKSQAQVQQARATLAKDLGQVEQARATLAKDQGLVRQARATLAKDEAQAQYAQAQFDRYSNLYKQGAVSQDQVQQYAANNKVAAAILQADREAIANAEAVVRGDEIAIENAEAIVEGDRAAIENAQAAVSVDDSALSNTQVQSSYTKIYAPIDGQAGNVLATEGNVVQANSTNPLVVIQKTRPIQVSFSVPESNLPDIQKYMDNGKLKVEVTLGGNAGNSSNGNAASTIKGGVNSPVNPIRPISGVLTFVNNTVDNTTGTVQLIGDFENVQGKLFPGQFVNATLTLTQDRNATVVPSQAVQNGPNGPFVFVVKPDDTVENVPVVVSRTVEGLNVIRNGVKPGDQVVTDGQANLVTGSKIRINEKNGNSNDRSNPNVTSSDSPSPSAGTGKDANNSPPRGKKRRTSAPAGGTP